MKQLQGETVSKEDTQNEEVNRNQQIQILIHYIKG